MEISNQIKGFALFVIAKSGKQKWKPHNNTVRLHFCERMAKELVKHCSIVLKCTRTALQG